MLGTELGPLQEQPVLFSTDLTFYVYNSGA